MGSPQLGHLGSPFASRRILTEQSPHAIRWSHGRNTTDRRASRHKVQSAQFVQSSLAVELGKGRSILATMVWKYRLKKEGLLTSESLLAFIDRMKVHSGLYLKRNKKIPEETESRLCVVKTLKTINTVLGKGKIESKSLLQMNKKTLWNLNRLNLLFCIKKKSFLLFSK